MKHLICLECPNGCNLTIDIEDNGTVNVSGNKCEKGIKFAVKILEEESQQGGALTATAVKSLQKRVVAKQTNLPYTQEVLSAVTNLWGIRLKTVHPSIDIEGSPERTIFRIVVEDQESLFYVLEQIPKQAIQKKVRITQTLDCFSQRNMSCIQPYLADVQKKCILEYAGGFWQIMPFIEGIPLERTKYIYEEWRGIVLSDFLIELKKKSESMPFFDQKEKFSITKYIHTLVYQIGKNQPELKKKINVILSFLEAEFIPKHDQFPVSFCHGDYHPLNIIWGVDQIKAVIDWEFCGYKPEIYDVSNLIGCIGMEHPSSLSGDLIVEFVNRLKASQLISDFSWNYLVEFLVAMRFAWLSEWLRKEDTEMIELETVYMQLLIDNKNDLKEVWGL